MQQLENTPEVREQQRLERIERLDNMTPDERKAMERFGPHSGIISLWRRENVNLGLFSVDDLNGHIERAVQMFAWNAQAEKEAQERVERERREFAEAAARRDATAQERQDQRNAEARAVQKLADAQKIGGADNPAICGSSIAAAEVFGGSVVVAVPTMWIGRGRAQMSGGKQNWGWKDVTIEPGITETPPETITVSWRIRPRGEATLPLEWQPVAGDDWQKSDGEPIGKTVIVLCEPYRKG